MVFHLCVIHAMDLGLDDEIPQRSECNELDRNDHRQFQPKRVARSMQGRFLKIEGHIFEFLESSIGI